MICLPGDTTARATVIKESPPCDQQDVRIRQRRGINVFNSVLSQHLYGCLDLLANAAIR